MKIRKEPENLLLLKDTSKEEIVNLRKQINRLKISLMFTQVLMIAFLKV